MSKPKFYQNSKIIMTMAERMEIEKANCPECSKNHWRLLPKENVAVSKDGKLYVECINCSYTIHI